MSGHTPGPWFVVPYGDGDSLVICKDDAGNARIAFMATPGCRDSVGRKRTWREIQANALLIAAAPALLDALDKIATLAKPGQEMALSDAIDALCDVWNEARATIAAATDAGS